MERDSLTFDNLLNNLRSCKVVLLFWFTVYYYNFAWKDYEHGTLEGLLDAVKVLSFAVTQGKVAVHCHAGIQLHVPVYSFSTYFVFSFLIQNAFQVWVELESYSVAI